jgi:uncharacterized protein (TIGR02466 family)
MITKNFDLFPILVQVTENFLTKSECELILKNLDVNRLSQHNALIDNSQGGSSYNASLLGIQDLDLIDSFLDIKSKLTDRLNHYSNTYGCNEFKISNSWINVQKPNSSLRGHVHAASLMSGALYLKVDKNSSSIVFDNPNPFIEFIECKPGHENIYNFSYYFLKPNIGDLFLFPSWLKHGGLEVNKSEERIVLSFNTYQINNV